MASMRDCPKYNHCSAPVCPLDDDWRERTQMNYEPVCFYLQEAAKHGGRRRIAYGTPDGMADRVFLVLEELLYAHGHSYIRYKLRQSSKTRSRINAGLQLGGHQDTCDDL